MKKHHTFILLLLVALLNRVSAQQTTAVKIGEKVPDRFIPQIVGYYKTTGKLADFRGKALILDFWFTHCGGCLGAMPKMDSLQREFGKDLQILMVTYESQKIITDFFKKDRFKNIRLPSVVNDKANLRKLFPHISEPHQIWIDKNGVVRAITDGQTTTRENVQKLIKGKGLNLPEASSMGDPVIANGVNPIILHDYEANQNLIRQYSYVSSYRKDLASIAYINLDTSKKSMRVTVLNWGLVDIYQYAYRNASSRKAPLYYSQRLTTVRNDTKPFSTAYDGTNFSNVFCFDAIIPDTSYKTAFQYVIQQLDYTFDLKTSYEKRQVKCLVLKEYGESKLYRTPGLSKESEFYLEKDTWIVNNALLNFFINDQNEGDRLPLPLINRTGYSGKASFRMLRKPENIQAMAEALHPYGLDLVEETCDIDMLVLNDRK